MALRDLPGLLKPDGRRAKLIKEGRGTGMKFVGFEWGSMILSSEYRESLSHSSSSVADQQVEEADEE